jgi:ferric-dicitrate binding protein FerR (iron transport regulator)
MDEQQGKTDRDVAAQLRRIYGRAVPPAEVEQQIAAGALARAARPSRGWGLRLGLVAAGVAVVAVVLVWVWPRQPAPADVGAGGLAPVTAPAAIQAGDKGKRLVVGQHEVQLAPQTRVRLVRSAPDGTELVLESGKARFLVKPRAGRFRVRAGPLLVEALGTDFSVEARGACGRVEVARGTVRVTVGQQKVQLVAGQARTFCPKVARPSKPLGGEAEVRQALGILASGKDLEKAARLLGSYLEQHPGGAFEQEALFHLCAVEMRLGHHDRAQRLAATFAQKYPGSRRAQRLRELVSRPQTER